MIDIESKSKNLKDFVSRYDTKYFLGEISSLMLHIRYDLPPPLKGLSSPQRQLYYLAALNISSESPETDGLKFQFSNEEFEEMKDLLNDIELGYEQMFYPTSEKEAVALDKEWKLKRKVSMPTFLSYFNQGQLNYEEQEIERIERYFAPFNSEIKAHFEIGVNDFVEIYNDIDSKPNDYLNAKINPKKGQQSWEEFAENMSTKGVSPEEWMEFMPQHFKDFFDFLGDKGKLVRFSKSELVEKFGTQKTNAFLAALTCKREKSAFLYYTERNPLQQKPIFQVDEDEFHAIEMKQILHAIYHNLMGYCISDDKLSEKFYKNRGICLENKIEEVFQTYFDGKAQVFKGFYTQEKHEQDLLILIGGLALIVEAKASKRDEPLRNPDKAYPMIVSNFEETIQKGYDQAFRVKEKFIDSEVLQIYRDQGLNKHVTNVNTRKYHHAFSVIVTLDRFGMMQTNLADLLEIYEDDAYPWSLCIDDLEVFLLQLKKLNKKKSALTHFLTLRELLHGKLVASDELEIFGAFLSGKINFQTASSDQLLVLFPDLAAIFDHTYQKGGLGFTNEKNMDLKNRKDVLALGGNY